MKSRCGIYFLVAGTTCTPWSSAGSALGWMDLATEPFAIYLAGLIAENIKLAIHEITPHAPVVDAFKRYLPPNFKIQSKLVCPSYHGQAMTRLRRITVMTLHTTNVLRVACRLQVYGKFGARHAIMFAGVLHTSVDPHMTTHTGTQHKQTQYQNN